MKTEERLALLANPQLSPGNLMGAWRDSLGGAMF
jgi:hypothetical protein